MSSSKGDSDDEDYFANLNSSDSSVSDSDEEISFSDDEEDSDEAMCAARQWYPLPVTDNLTPPPPPFPFAGEPGLSNAGNVSEMTPLYLFIFFTLF